MQKLYLTLGILCLATGCATSPPDDQLAVGIAADGSPSSQLTASPVSDASPSSQLAASPTPVDTVDIADYDEVTICEEIRRPGSRIVLGEHCYTLDTSMAAAADENRKQQVMLIQDQMRREQEAIERMQRQREMDRQQAIMRMPMQR